MHFERGQDYRRAVLYLKQAAKKVIHRNAYQEAIDHLTKGLELLKTLPDTRERSQQELDLQISLGGALQIIKGSAAREVEHAYARARELGQHLGDASQSIRVLSSLATIYEALSTYLH